MKRPNIEEIKSGQDFNKWYWLKSEMIAVCQQMNLPTNGRKFDLRDRIMYALDHEGKLLQKKKTKPISNFNWRKATLKPETIITDNIIFGQNLRRFMKTHLGEQFSFNTDFMAWMKANTDKTLKHAVETWKILEKRKNDPNFQTDIADHNMYNQYTRDFLKDNPNTSLKQVRKCWHEKRKLPMKDGFVKYERSDIYLVQ